MRRSSSLSVAVGFAVVHRVVLVWWNTYGGGLAPNLEAGVNSPDSLEKSRVQDGEALPVSYGRKRRVKPVEGRPTLARTAFEIALSR